MRESLREGRMADAWAMAKDAAFQLRKVHQRNLLFGYSDFRSVGFEEILIGWFLRHTPRASFAYDWYLDSARGYLDEVRDVLTPKRAFAGQELTVSDRVKETRELLDHVSSSFEQARSTDASGVRRKAQFPRFWHSQIRKLRARIMDLRDLEENTRAALTMVDDNPIRKAEEAAGKAAQIYKLSRSTEAMVSGARLGESAGGEQGQILDDRRLLEDSLKAQAAQGPRSVALADPYRAKVQPAPILVAATEWRVLEEARAMVPAATSLAVYQIPAGLTGGSIAEALEKEASRIGASYTIFFEEADLNAQAKREFVRFIHQADIAERAILLDLLNGNKKVSDLSAEIKSKLFDELVGLLPRIAPKTVTAEDVKLWSLERQLLDLKLNLHHPSFGFDMTHVDPADQTAPYAVIWTLESIVKDPLFFEKLEDRDQKLAQKMSIADHVLIRENAGDLEKILGPRMDAFRKRFGQNIHRSDSRSVRELYDTIPSLAGSFKPEHVIFVDMEQGSTLEQATDQDKKVKMLLVRGESIITDKIAAVILAAGENDFMLPKGLSRRGNLFILTAVKPIDFDRHFKQITEELQAVGTAA